uniref:Secreted protein n=1 Tax=Parastrongyloides trichosuri TaxID=131310 RepID=A0A0N4YZY9_PARTI
MICLVTFTLPHPVSYFITFLKRLISSFQTISPEQESNWRLIDAASETSKIALKSLSDKSNDAWTNLSSRFGTWVNDAKKNVQTGLTFIADDVIKAKDTIISKVGSLSNTAEEKYGKVKTSFQSFANAAENL